MHSAETIKPIKSFHNNNNITNLMNNNRNIIPTLKPNSITSNNNLSSCGTKNNDISLIHNNKWHNNNLSNLNENSCSKKYACSPTTTYLKIKTIKK